MPIRGDADALVGHAWEGVSGIRRLEISGVRVLRGVGIVPDPGMNLVVGGNGAGKTSLLEAIHLLGTGRSFRTREVEKLVAWGEAGLSVFAEVDGSGGSPARLGLSRDGQGGIRLRLNGEDVKGFSRVAKLLPLAVFGPESHEIVVGPPERRRALMDWALFHVEPNYGETLQRYRRALRQRNAVLREGCTRASARAWEADLGEAGDRLHAWRAGYAEKLVPRLTAALAGVLGAPVHMGYRPGWNVESPLVSALEEAWAGDIARGWTALGPHMADLTLEVGSQPVRHVLSRGEAKTLVAALMIAHIQYLLQCAQRRPVVLADDVPSELDERARAWFCRQLMQLGCQVFLTAVERWMLPALDSTYAPTVFHVEQGHVYPLV